MRIHLILALGWCLTWGNLAHAVAVAVDWGQHQGDEVLVYHADGRVEWTGVRNSARRDPALQKLPASPPGSFEPAPAEYVPTVLPDEASATMIFNSLNPRFRSRSECYNRAHVWAYESKQKLGLDSMKVFLFFTSRYIRQYHYGWWFHVSPYTLVREAPGPARERVLDFAFLKSPLPMREWTDQFVASHTECPQALRYADYREHQNEADCYVMKASMYFWQPRDLERLDSGAAPKSEFIDSEVAAAYRQGFMHSSVRRSVNSRTRGPTHPRAPL